MGLRTASVRHPHAEVMAPALTETSNQTQTFKLSDHQSASPINANGTGIGKNGDGESLYIAREAATCKSLPNGKDLNNVFDALEQIAATGLLKGDTLNPASDLNSSASDCGLPINMSTCPISSMGEHEPDKMGLQKVSLDDVSDLLKGDVDQIFNHLPAGDADEIMQVFKSIDAADPCPDPENDPMFSAGELSLAENAIDDALFNVDVMNMSIDDQLMESACIKETQTKERLVEVGKTQAKLERKLDFLLRRIRKFQVYNMGQHVSAEVAGVYEHVHRTLTRGDASDVLSQTMSSTVTNSSSASESHKPISYSSTKNLIKKLEMSSAVLANNANAGRQKKCFGAGSNEAVAFRPPPVAVGQCVTLPLWTTHEKLELQNVSGNLEYELRLVQEEADSEATVSSSGGESCDESENFNNQHQQYLPISKRAAWKYAVDRSAIASKWTWLQSQIADLDYKIRQHNELHRKIRNSKETVKLGGVSPPHHASVPSSPNCLNGYRGQLPGASSIRNGESVSPNGATKSMDYQCARTRPLVNFRKRKLVQITGLHAISKKAARPATMRCGCIPPNMTCALCTGRTDPTYPRDHSEYLSRNETLGLLDSSYHPVFSLTEDASASLHMEAIMKTADWQQRSSRTNLKALKSSTKGERSEKSTPMSSTSGTERPRKNNEHRRKYNRLIKPSTANAITAKIKNKYRRKVGKPGRHPVGRMKKRARMSSAQSLGSDGADDEVEALGIGAGGKFDSPSSSPLLSQAISGFNKRNRVDSYDIDNIIIPYSVASSTRVEKLQYKEILTPKWRIAEGDINNESTTKHNGIVKTSQDTNKDSDKDNKDNQEKEEMEDLSEIAVLFRHERSEQDERKKFLSFLKLPIGYGRSRANRRTDSLAESSGANTPDPMSPAPAPNNIPEPPNNDNSPLTSPPPTPMPMPMPVEEPLLPNIAALRRRTFSVGRPRDRDREREREEMRSSTPDLEVPPYDKRLFPLCDELYERIVRGLPDENKLKTNRNRLGISSNSQGNSTSQPSLNSQGTSNAPSLREFVEAGKNKDADRDSESTESAYEDPNDPEWEDEVPKDRERFNR